MRHFVNRISIAIPSIPERAEFPIIFLTLFLPAYLNQDSLPQGLFDSPFYHIMTIFHSLLILSLVFYLLQKTPPETEESAAALTGEIRISETALVLGGLILLYGLYNLILTGLHRGGLPLQEDPLLISRGIMLLPSLLTCLAAAAMEEFFFRGYAFFRIRRGGIPPLKALIVLNLLFAAGHLYEGVPAALFALCSGIFLSLAVVKGCTLFSLSAAHGLFNFLMILMSYIRQAERFS